MCVCLYVRMYVCMRFLLLFPFILLFLIITTTKKDERTINLFFLFIEKKLKKECKGNFFSF